MNAKPGQRLCDATEYHAGANTVIIDDQIYATVYGTVQINNQLKEISVLGGAQRRLAQSGDICIARVVYVSKTQVDVQILQIENNIVKQIQKGILRYQDQKNEKYQYGDYCMCKILTIGDQYLLTTKEQDLGVLDTQKFMNQYSN